MVKASTLKDGHPYAYYLMTGYSDYQPIMVRCAIGFKLIDDRSKTEEFVSTPFLPHPLRSKGGFKPLPPKANS